MEDSVLTDQPALSQNPTIIPSSPPRVSLRPVYLALTFILGILIGVGGLFGYQEYTSTNSPVTTYDECIKTAGSRVQESYPSTCITKDGKRFTQPTMDDDGINPIYTDPLSCNTDNDCTTGIQTSGCCACPKAINKTEIGKDNWVLYSPGKDYSNTSTCKTLVACKPCESPAPSVCRDNQCEFFVDASDNETESIPPISILEKTTGWYWGTIDQKKSGTPVEWIYNNAGKSSCWHKPGVTCTPKPSYSCPQAEWVDCMPGPDAAGIKFECTDEFLTWAQTNCPNFQGAAY